MKKSVHFKILKTGLLMLVIFMASVTTRAQRITGINAIMKNEGHSAPAPAPELVFTNPILIWGSSNQDGAVYLFQNVTSGVDATVTILGRSSTQVILDTIDLPGSVGGWDKALQPQLGIAGSVPVNQNWWMRFQVNFWYAGSLTKKYQAPQLTATALDIDGDGASIQEYVQLDNVSAISYSPVTYLTQLPTTLTFPYYGDDNENGDDNGNDGNGHGGRTISNISNVAKHDNATNYLIQAPVANAPGIDTSATGNMVNATWMNTNQLTFTYGATSGVIVSNAGERLNSLWFKSFNLAPPSTLPVTLTSFSANTDKKNVGLTWTTAKEINLSQFVIERSSDGKKFSPVALVFANGGNQLANYSYKDPNVNSSTGVLFYRLRMVDESQEAAYSETRIIRLSQETDNVLKIVTFPNPATDLVRVTLPNTWQGKEVRLELYSGNGLLVNGVQLKNASQTENIPLTNLSRGFYMIKASCNGEMAQQRVIKN